MKLQTLDCNLRDEGYYLNWSFDKKTSIIITL